mmetsp:Transcript_42270/g.112007  ORF Transcript_42270/g.112007 Transcript_42270/m.112007 type:complete len:103 (-) Transcript_42270:327-635(-)
MPGTMRTSARLGGSSNPRRNNGTHPTKHVYTEPETFDPRIVHSPFRGSARVRCSNLMFEKAAVQVSPVGAGACARKPAVIGAFGSRMQKMRCSVQYAPPSVE